MTVALLQFLGLAVIVIAAGSFLSHCADAIAEKTGFGRLLVGSVLLAGATSLPELTVDVSAVRLGLPDLAVGDLLGSSLMNLLILAVLDLTHYSRGKLLSRTGAAHALSGLFAVSLTGLVGLAIATTQRVETWTFLGAHAWLWVIAGGYFLGVRMVFLDQRIAVRVQADKEAAHETRDAAAEPTSSLSLRRALLGFAAAACVIVLAGPKLAESAGKIAELSGLGNTFVGTTLVALCTSLPELAASLAAVRMGSHDLAIGNVFGSNAFNMLLFLPLDIACPGTLFTLTSTGHVVSAFAVITATSLVVIGQLYHVERRTPLFEPDALMVIAVVMASLAIVYFLG
ncbi:MAG: hypothetical protein U0939_04635 [Pirellulales bacterium]